MAILRKVMFGYVSQLLTPGSLIATGKGAHARRISIGWAWAYTPGCAREGVVCIERHVPRLTARPAGVAPVILYAGCAGTCHQAVR